MKMFDHSSMLLAIPILLLAPAEDVQPPVFGCDDIVVGAYTWGGCENKLGLLYDVRVAPVEDGHPTVQVRYSSTWGTGVNEGVVSVLQKRGHQYRVLWTHHSIEVDNNGDRAEHYAKIYRWRFDKSGARITLTGMEKRGGDFDLNTGAGEASSVRRLPPEAFCYSGHKGRFTRCK